MSDIAMIGALRDRKVQDADQIDLPPLWNPFGNGELTSAGSSSGF